MGKRWSNSDDEYLKAHYETSPMPELVAHLGRTINSIHQRAFLLGLKRPNPRFWSEEETNYLKEHWALIPTRELVSNLGRTYESVRMRAQRLGIPKQRRFCWYAVNEHAFDVLTPETAYVLGLILADGCIKGDYIEVSGTDKDILVKSLNILGASSYPLREYSRPPYKNIYVFTIHSTRLVSRLLELGITPRKSKTATLPPIPNNLFSHFVRGYFDGDGNAHFNDKGKWLAVTFVSGSKKLMEQLSKRIATLTTLPEKPVKQSSNKRGWLLKYYGLDAMTLADWMYSNANSLYLSRKREPFLNYQRHHINIAPYSSSANPSISSGLKPESLCAT